MSFAIERYKDFITGQYNIFRCTECDKDALEVENSLRAKVQNAIIDEKGFLIMDGVKVNRLDKSLQPNLTSENTSVFAHSLDCDKVKKYSTLRCRYKLAVVTELESKASCIESKELGAFINNQHDYAIHYLNSFKEAYDSDEKLFKQLGIGYADQTDHLRPKQIDH